MAGTVDDTAAAMLRRVSLLPELARANILADFASRNPIDSEFVAALFAAWHDLDEEEVSLFIAQTRRAAGQPMPDGKLINSTLLELRAKHASSALSGLMRSAGAQERIRALVEQETQREDTDPLLGLFVREYEKRIEREASQITETINSSLSSIRSTQDDFPSEAVSISEQLARWMGLATPMLAFYNWRGHPEPRSKSLFNSVRDVSLWLANDRERHTDAMKLSNILIDRFAQVEELKAIATKDVDDLKDIIVQRKEAARFQRLEDSIEAAKVSAAEFERISKQEGMTKRATAPVGFFVSAINEFLDEGGDVDLAAVVGRDLALSFNNDAENPGLAYSVMEFVFYLTSSKMSPQTRQKFDEDLTTLFRNWKFPLLEKHRGNTSNMIAALEGIVSSAPAAAKAEFSAFLDVMRRKRQTSRIKWGVGLAVLGFIVISSIISNNNNRSSYRTSSYGSSSSSGTYTAPSTTSYTPPQNTTYTPAPKPVPVQPVDLHLEARPPFGSGQTLTKDQIRYCVFQGKRLDYLRNLPTTNAAVDKFNELVGDFNDRCSSYRYRESDMSSVEAEAVLRTSTFLSEVSTIAKGW
jgi:hypothetical protein